MSGACSGQAWWSGEMSYISPSVTPRWTRLSTTGAQRHDVRPAHPGDAADQAPALGQAVGAVQAELRHGAAARGISRPQRRRLARPHAVVIVVQIRIAKPEHRLRLQPQPAAAERIFVAETQLAAARDLGNVVQQLGIGDAPSAARLRAEAGVDARFARPHARKALGHAIAGIAFE